MELKNLVVNSVCSPTRAAFLTGLNAVRNGFGAQVGGGVSIASLKRLGILSKMLATARRFLENGTTENRIYKYLIQ